MTLILPGVLLNFGQKVMEKELQEGVLYPIVEAQCETGEIVVYQPDEITRLEVRVEDESVWLTQAQMAYLFQKDQSVVARHIKNVFDEGELDRESNMQILHNTLSKYRPVSIYSLDVIISVGYRVLERTVADGEPEIHLGRVLYEILKFM